MDDHEKEDQVTLQMNMLGTNTKLSSLSQTHKRTLDSEAKTEQVVRVIPSEYRRSTYVKGVKEYLCDHGEAKSSAMKRAEEIQDKLAVKFPSFMKTMSRSHVSGGFGMHKLPAQFCRMHLPRHDTIVILEDESGKDYETKYLAQKAALSAGWKGFSVMHELIEGDILIFQLVEPSKFKVYIVRVNGLPEVDGGFVPPSLDAWAKQNDPEKDIKRFKTHKKATSSDQSESGSKDNGSDALRGVRFTGSNVDFKGVKNIHNFTILVNGLTIDSEFSEYHRIKYYELCRAQKSFLHDHLRKNINHKLAAEIISETINIADAIRASKLSTPTTDFENWDNTLKSFELLGMNVSFLRARLDRLVSLALEAEAAGESERYTEVRLEQARAEEEMNTLRLKLLKLKETKERLDIEIQTLKLNVKRLELMFQEATNAPW